MDNTTGDTSNFLDWVEIKNFKSVKELRLDCKRVNIFIGKPNVGKSNILEGLGMLGASFDNEKYLNGSVRYGDLRDLFWDNDTESGINIQTNLLTTTLVQDSNFELDIQNRFSLIKKSNDSTYRDFLLNNHGKVSAFSAGVFTNREMRDHFETYQTSPIKKYDFKQLDNYQNSYSQYLLPPHGINMYAVINRNERLWEEFAKLFKNQQLELVLSDYEQSFVLQKKEGHRTKQYPYFSIADTFRRYIFYIAAIESNKNSVIVFEEPEVHSFPPYTQELAYRMIYDESNQYFISTHSPYMLHPFIEKMDYKDLNVFVTYYKDYQTHVRALTEEELTDILDFSTNVFFNLNKFEPNA